MKKINYFLFVLILLTFGCETTPDALTESYGDYVSTVSPEDRERLDNFTDGGRTLFPSGDRMTAEVNQVGDARAECSASHVDSTSNTSGRSSYPTALKNYPTPSRGCVAAGDISIDQARAAMRRQNMTFARSGTDPQTGLPIQAPTEANERTLGAALVRMQQLNGGTFNEARYGGSSPFEFRLLQRRYSRQEPAHIKIAYSNQNSVAQYVHEIAHFVANQNGRRIYSQYQNALGGGNNFCMVSGYADGISSQSHAQKWSEQFAEAFTAFVTEPSLLTNNGSPACRKAFDFFKNLFDKGEKVSECM